MLLRFEQGDMSSTEIDELLELMDHAESQVEEAIAQQLEHQVPAVNMDMGEWATVLESIVAVDRISAKRTLRLSFAKWAAAAVLLITLGFAAYFYLQPGRQSKGTDYAGQITPGKNDAVLTLADGSKISLTDAGNGELVKAPGVRIVKSADGSLIYTVDTTGLEQSSNTANLVYNTISTPRGGEYQVNLPDGTKVWLNAASSLKFPQSFRNLKERRVELNGEAYFEVSKRKNQPFIVASADFGHDRAQEIEVLGTHFNISAYADDVATKTTLLEGSVRVREVRSSGNPNTAILVPGQQAVIGNGKLSTLMVDTEEAIAWKNGNFIFDNADIESIMRRVSRWYNVEVVYQGKIPEANFMGTVSRFSNVSEILDILEATKTVHFKIEGRRITVMP